jgi:8-oxo-dGTP pyrophosphatase MutT (NUDIX family)
LDSHRSVGEKEKADVELIRNMVLLYENILSSGCEPGHITGSALVIELESGRFLLHHHKALHRWLQLGGHMLNGEIEPSRTALREAKEESGLPDLVFFPTAGSPRPLDIDVHVIPALNGKPEHLHLDFRYLLATMSPEQLSPGDNESQFLRWLSMDDVDRTGGQIDPNLRRLISKSMSVYAGYSTGRRQDARHLIAPDPDFYWGDDQ